MANTVFELSSSEREELERRTRSRGGRAEDSRIAIQSALDVALITAGLAAGSVLASIDVEDGGLILTSLATGATETLDITSDDGLTTTSRQDVDNDGVFDLTTTQNLSLLADGTSTTTTQSWSAARVIATWSRLRSRAP